MSGFNSKHFIFVILGLCVVSMKSYPSRFTQLSGRDTWIAAIVASILIMLYALYIYTICEKNNNYSFYDIYCKALGKPLGIFFLFIYILTILLVLIESATIESNAIHNHMLLETPTWFFLLFMVIPGIYVVSKGRGPILIVCVVALFIISMLGINLSILSQKYKHINYLLPRLENGINKNFILCTLKILGCYSFITIALMFINEIENKTKLKKHMLWGLFFTVQMEVVGIIGALTTFTIERVNQSAYVKLTQTQLIRYFGILESGELYVLFQFVGGWFSKYILTMYALIQLLQVIKKHNNRTSLIIISIIVSIPSFFISPSTLLIGYLLNYYLYICLVNFIVIPFIIFTIFHIRNNYARTN
ncbi:MAG: endospore germination permease [Clostridiaceae bacterium]